jgi:hypothetical protein
MTNFAKWLLVEILGLTFVTGTCGIADADVNSATRARTVMLPNRLIVGWCLGVVAVSTGGAVATSLRSLPNPPTPAAIRVAQNATDRNRALADIPNSASVSLRMSPGQSVSVGTKVSFRVTTKKPGYLLLVDIDANGNMSQIFPSPEMIVQSQEAATNLIKPGEELLIPNSAAKQRGFEYVITPPAGEATIVAILSDRRVQIIDLPDRVQKAQSEAETIGNLTRWTSGLRVPDPGTGKLQPSNWSFDIKQYSIRE